MNLLVDQMIGLKLSGLTQLPSALRWIHDELHCHPRGRIIYVTKGQGRMIVDGLTVGYGPNNLIYLPPQTLYAMDVGPTVYGYIIDLPSDFSWLEDVLHLRLLDVAPQKQLLSLVEAIEREISPSGSKLAAACHFGLLQVFVERQCAIAKPTSNDARRQSASAKLTRRYTRLVARSYASGMLVKDYAAQLGVTPIHLGRACYASSERTALTVLSQTLIRAARYELCYTDTSVKEISKALGFQNPPYFTRRFQQMTGLTPTAFREKVAPHAARES